MTVVHDAIAEGLAELAVLQLPPVEPFGYGRDLSCITSLDRRLTTTDPDSTDGILEASIRAIITPRGTVPEDPDGGIDLRAEVNRAHTKAQLAALEARCKAEILKDDRLADAGVTLTPNPREFTLRVSIRLVPADPKLVAFTHVFAIDKAGDVILERLAQ